MNDTQVLIETMSWNPDTQRDDPLGYICVSIMLQISATEGKWFSHNCETPDDLWACLKDLDQDRDIALKHFFGYSGPPKPPPPKSADDMLNELDKL